MAGALPWANLMSILKEKNGADPELLVYTVTLINKVWVGTRCQSWLGLLIYGCH